MHDTSAFDLPLLAVLLSAAALLVLAYRTSVPYPILLVIGGAVIGFVPGLPAVELPPEAVLVIFLPPLLYAAAFFSSLRDLRDNRRPIGLLAIVLVVMTTLGVGVVAHAVVDDLSWRPRSRSGRSSRRPTRSRPRRSPRARARRGGS